MLVASLLKNRKECSFQFPCKIVGARYFMVRFSLNIECGINTFI